MVERREELNVRTRIIEPRAKTSEIPSLWWRSENPSKIEQWLRQREWFVQLPPLTSGRKVQLFQFLRYYFCNKEKRTHLVLCKIVLVSWFTGEKKNCSDWAFTKTYPMTNLPSASCFQDRKACKKLATKVTGRLVEGFILITTIFPTFKPLI